MYKTTSKRKNPAVQKSQIRGTGGLAKATQCGKGRIIQHETGCPFLPKTIT